MGAALSTDKCPLAIAAVAEITQCGRIDGHSEHPNGGPDAHSELGDDESHTEDVANPHADSEHLEDLPWPAFLQALDEAKLAASDRAILERMFTLMDKTGDELVSCRELLVGACALLQGDLASKLQAAVEIHRLSARGSHGRRASASAASHGPSHDALLFILTMFATVANFFGDPLLKKTALSKVVQDVLDSPEDPDSKTDESGTPSAMLQRLARHPVVERYIRQITVDADAQDAA